MQRILRSLSRSKDRLGVRIVHYSVQRDHLRLIVEATDVRSLSRAMQGLSVRIAKALNRALGRPLFGKGERSSPTASTIVC